MPRSSQAPLLLVVGGATAAVFLADLLTPLGIAGWVFYLLPVAISVFGSRPSLPLLVAAVASSLTVVGYFLSPVGSLPELPLINRAMAGATIWLVAGIARTYVVQRLEVERHEWLGRGEKDLARSMVGDKSVDEVGDAGLAALARHLGAAVGVAWVPDETGDLTVRGAYALGARHDLPRLAPGQGLPGQAARDRETIHVQEAPAEYLEVRSGSGRARPVDLVVVPAVIDDRVEAVVELGFLRRVRAADLELLARTSASFAVGIRAASYRDQVRDLLEETRRQAEELEQQQEELRATNEDLEHQTLALEEAHTALERKQAELEEVNTGLEHQTQSLEEQKAELLRTRKRLSEHATELSRASQYKSEFLANMSHELRTPLNSALIMARLLADNRDRNLTAEQVAFAETIYSAGKDLLVLIDDVLDLSKVEAGKLELYPAPVTSRALVESMRLAFAPMAADRGLAFEVTIDPAAPQSIVTDGTRVQQILRNLLSNAIKFTEVGSVSLRVAAHEHGVAFSVVDTGIGIAPDRLEQVFEAFRQGNGTLDRKYGGTGLGLAIARDLATRLGGRIEVQSTDGRGSTFTLVLPGELSVTPSEPAPAAVLSPQASPRPSAPQVTTPIVDDDRQRVEPGSRVVLVVEDDPAFARLLLDLAREQGFAVLVAGTAAEAIELARAHAVLGIVLDLRLPDEHGLAVLDRIKRDPATRHVPVHVISGYEHDTGARRLGAIGYLRQPVGREDLVAAFARLEQLGTGRVRRLLVVEDDQGERDAIVALLHHDGIDTVAVATIGEALERLRHSTFDCVVLDLVLPDGTGFQLLDAMAREDMPFPPVVVHTGHALSADEEERLRRYASAVVAKDGRAPERLLAEVSLFLHQAESELPADRRRMLEEFRSRDASLEGRRVLVVEDDIRNVFALTSLLEPRGLRLKVARNGREALEVMHREAIDLVLMDIMMPEMDGLEATRLIRAREEWRRLPIIALTAKAMRDDRERCLEAGASDYLAKPLEAEKVLSLLRVWMPR